MPGSHKKKRHTPIVSKKQFGLFGAEYSRRKRGKKPRMKGITTAELRRHLKEAKGKSFLKGKRRKRRKKYRRLYA